MLIPTNILTLRSKRNKNGAPFLLRQFRGIDGVKTDRICAGIPFLFRSDSVSSAALTELQRSYHRTFVVAP